MARELKEATISSMDKSIEYHPRSKAKGYKETIIVFRPGHLGDALVSLPAIKTIRESHPNARLILLTDHHPGKGVVSSWEVFGPTGFFEDVFYFQPEAYVGSMWNLGRELRRLTPTMLYYLPPMPRSLWQVTRDGLFFRAFCKIQHFVGLRSTGPYPIRNRDGSLPRMKRESERLLGWIGDGVPNGNFRNGKEGKLLDPQEKDRAKIHRLLAQVDSLDSTLMAVCPGAKTQTQRYPEEKFQSLGQELLKRFPYLGLVVFGGKEDESLGDRLCQAWGKGCLNVAGVLTVWESAAALQLCSLYIGNDTGTMHLAASVGIPCLAIFSGRDNPGRWEPWGEKHSILRNDVPCAGCYREICVDEGLICLNSITVEQVLERVFRYFPNTADSLAPAFKGN